MKSNLLNPPSKISEIGSEIRGLQCKEPDLSGAPAHHALVWSRERALLSLSCRLVFSLFSLGTSFWCLLAYVRLTYLTVVTAPSHTLLPTILRWHFLLLWPVVLLVGWSLLPDLRAQRTRRLAAGFLSFLAGAGVFCLFQHPFSGLRNNGISYLLSLFVLCPLLWMAVIDFAACYRARWATKVDVREDTSGTFFSVRFILTAVLLTEAFNLLCFHVRQWFVYKSPTIYRNEWLLVLISLSTQILLMLLVLSVFHAARLFASSGGDSGKRRFWMNLFLLWLALAVFSLKLPLKVLMLSDLPARIYAVVLSTVITIFIAGAQLRRAPSRSPQQPARGLSRLEQTLCVGVLLLLDYCVPGIIGNFDWQLLLTRLWALVFCGAVMLSLYLSGRIRRSRFYSWPALLLIFSLSIGGNILLHAAENWWPGILGQRDFNAHDALENYASNNGSFVLARMLLATTAKDPCDSFCYFLKENSNLSPRNIPSKRFELVDQLTPTSGTKPNIFIIVVDSLRQDYLSPYNAAVDFTPEIQKFAQESIVMRNAFTRYGGTALSEPAIWSGAMQLHTLYVQPYRYINSLEKLIRVDGYHSYLARDYILQQILDPEMPVTNLDDEHATFAGGYDLCNTVAHAEELFDKKQDARPIFFYAQPQNIHITTLHDLPIIYHPRRSYSGFSPKYASELERVDGCFGNFIQYLQKRGLYENSIVVLTADHGEAMEEERYETHSFSLRPEVLRVPLIFHLPPKFQKSYFYDPQEIAFTIDITPSMYYLLGHRPIRHGEFFGRPLFTETRGEQKEYLLSEYLVASSYGPVFGILAEHSEQLYIDDSVEYRRRFYKLKEDPLATRNLVNEEVQLRYQPLIRQHLKAIADFYGYTKRSGMETFRSWLLEGN